LKQTFREDLDGVRGKAFHVDLEMRQFELLKETVIDPQSDEGRSRHTVRWGEDARFIRIVQQNGFMGVDGPVLIHVHALDEENAPAASAGEPFVVMHVTIPAVGEDTTRFEVDAHNIAGVFTPDPASNRQWGGTIHLNGKEVPMRLRGPRAQVTVRSLMNERDFGAGFWEVMLRGAYMGESFVASQLELSPLLDPRTVDDPDLPRVLVIGDSISMNYHNAAKAVLDGVANYYRIEGNGGPTTRGVLATELWLGNYKEEGLHWDLIQFNFGLHDLRQSYNPETNTFGEHQVRVAEYKANLERIIAILRETGATLMWCTTTPVPQSRTGRWPEPIGHAGRRQDEDLVFNAAAMEVMQRHPDIRVSDLNGFARAAPELEAWHQQHDVHFWGGAEQQVVGTYVAEQIMRALGK